MVWVRSEYAGEFAVLSAWISALVPWYLTYIPDGPGGTPAFYMRFPFFQFRFFPAYSFSENLEQYRFVLPWKAERIGFNQDFALAYDFWYVGLAVVLAALALSFTMYVAYERVEAALPIHPVRVMGGLLLLEAGVLGLSSAVFVLESPFESQYPLPLGVLIVLVLAVSLLRVELIEDDTGSGDGEEGQPPRDGTAADAGE